jgi:ABC-type polysaccharide/polyol phosphate transport system ATPase subunit
MNPDLAVDLSGISKMYRLFDSKGDRVREALHPGRRIYHREHWSLRDINLQIPRGSTFGLLGVNGSGKSTLLQIIAGVLQPTRGTCEVRGRVAALLELGAGFNPALTGRENVITNAYIMGLDRSRIDARLDEVEAFADIGAYFDQPVRTYSSGMFMRVAFAMSINVDPDVLIVDEALAVGDARFQEKCFRRIRAFQEAGKTILYVTHDRASVTNLCTGAALLHQGRLVAQGAPGEIVDMYSEVLTTGRLPPDGGTDRLELTAAAANFVAVGADGSDRLPTNPLYNSNESVYGQGGATVVDALVLCEGRENPPHLASGAEVELLVRVRFDAAHPHPLVGLTLTNVQGVVLYGTHSGWLNQAPMAPAVAGSVHSYRFRLRLPVAAGPWFLDLAVAQDSGSVSQVRGKAIALEVVRQGTMVGLVDLAAAVEEVVTPAMRSH